MLSIEKNNNDCIWINEFENILSERRFSKSSNHSTPKRKRLDVVPGKSITVVFEDPDDPDSIQPELEIESSIVIIIPASNEPVASSSQVNSMSTTNMHDSDDDDENFQKKLKINEFILVKFLYGEGTKKKAYKMFPSIIKAVGESTKGIVFTCLFMRPFKGSSNTFVFPSVDDIAEVIEEDVVLRLKLIKEQRGCYTFDL